MHISINWHNLDPSAAVEADIHKRFAKLTSYTEGITNARLSINQPHHPSRKPHAFETLLEIHVPGKVIVAKEPAATGLANGEACDLHLLIHHVFDAANRQLLDHKHLHQGRTQQHLSARDRREPSTEPPSDAPEL